MAAVPPLALAQFVPTPVASCYRKVSAGDTLR